MAGASPPQLSPGMLAAVQWTLIGVEVLVLACVMAWLGRNSRLGRLVRRLARRSPVTGLTPESSMELGGSRAARMVSAGGGSPQPAHTTVAPAAPPSRPASGTPRSLRLTRTPARAHEGVGTAARPMRAPTSLHCPGCGALLLRGEVATRLVTRCTGCERRVAVRLDGDRVVVTLES